MKSKKMMGIIGLVLTICLCSNLNNTFATESGLANKAIFDLIAYDIISSDAVLSSESQVTRAEAADVVNRMLGLNEIENKQPMYFKDVETENSYLDAINNVAQAGIINGDENGFFHPNDFVSMQDAAKIFVCTLGYDYLAKDKGYPVGYLTTAMNIGLLDGVAQTELLYADMFYVMAYNALDIDIMSKRIGSGEYYIGRDDTLRRRLSFDRDSSLHKGKGIVSANYYTYIDEAFPNLEENQVVIEGRIYDCGTTDAAKYVGQQVEFYAREEDGRWILANVKPNNQSYTLTISSDALIGVQGREIKYEADEKERKARVAADFIYIYNNVPQTKYDASVLNAENGELTLIYNDGDTEADIVFRNEYEYVRVDSIVNNRLYFSDNRLAVNQPSITIDLEDDAVKYVIQDAQGSEVALEDIQKDDVLSILADEYKSYYKIIVSSKTVSGVVKEQKQMDGKPAYRISEDEEWYISVDGMEKKLELNSNVTVYLNHKNQIVSVQVDAQDNNYGYIVKWAEGDGMVQPSAVQMLCPGKLSTEYEVDDSDPDNVIRTPYLKGRNSEVKELKLADNFKVNGTRFIGSLDNLFGEFFNRIVKYDLNKDGKLARIDFAERIGSGSVRKYNGYDRIFGGFGNGAFGTDDNTFVICVPENNVSSIEDYYAEIEINNGSQYNVVGFDIEEQIANLVAITMPMQSDGQVEINENRDKIAVASEVLTTLDENGETKLKMTFLSEGKEMSYEIADSAYNTVAGMREGDVFFYTLNTVGEIGKIKLLCQLIPQPPMENSGSADTSEGKIMFGALQEVEYEIIDDISNQYVDRLHIAFDESGSESAIVDVSKRNTPPIYTVNRQGEVAVGERADLASAIARNNYIFVRSSGSKVRGIVLISY